MKRNTAECSIGNAITWFFHDYLNWLTVILGCRWCHRLGTKKKKKNSCPYLPILLKPLIAITTGCIIQLLLFLFYCYYILQLVFFIIQPENQALKRKVCSSIFSRSKNYEKLMWNLSRDWCRFERFQALTVYESWTEWLLNRNAPTSQNLIDFHYEINNCYSVIYYKQTFIQLNLMFFKFLFLNCDHFCFTNNNKTSKQIKSYKLHSNDGINRWQSKKKNWRKRKIKPKHNAIFQVWHYEMEEI